jgi:catechol 2,3-dioxygenase
MTTGSNRPPGALPSETHVGHIRLRVPDIERSLSFYRDLLGFRLVAEDPGDVVLSASGHAPYHILLSGDPSAAPRPPRTTGLYHLAIRFPGRPALASLLARLLEHDWPLHGASDHGVSEAIYLADPDGNGIELYVDRPRSTWRRAAGQIAMTTERLDFEGLLAEAGYERRVRWQIDPATDLGHIHLQVSDLGRAERFYTTLGLEVTQRSYPGALFLSAGGYHHHVGLNVWASQGAPAPPSGARGLVSFSLVLPDDDSLDDLVGRLQRVEVGPAQRVNHGSARGLLVHDPDGIGIELLVLQNS